MDHLYIQEEFNSYIRSLTQFSQFNLPEHQLYLYNNSLKLAIEYCDLRFGHEEICEKYLNYKVYKACEKENIRLITIFSDEWVERNFQVKGYLESVIDGSLQHIYARKCEVKLIDKETGSEFIEKYHIQGKKSSIQHFGLFHNGILVGTLSLGYHHRNPKYLTLDRLCFKNGVRIVGGASKLWKIAEKWCVEHKIEKVISWSDNRWSQGNVYYKIGFVLEEELKPDYSYVFMNCPEYRVSKQSQQKKKIGCPPHIMEHEFLLEMGYARIWDCGKKRFVCQIG